MIKRFRFFLLIGLGVIIITAIVIFFLSKLKFFQISRYFSIPRLLFLREILFISVNNPGARAPKVIIPPVAIIANVAFKTDLAVLFSEIILFICFTTPWSRASNFIGLCFGIF